VLPHRGQGGGAAGGGVEESPRLGHAHTEARAGGTDGYREVGGLASTISFSPPCAAIPSGQPLLQEILLLPRCCGDDLVRAWGPPGPWSETTGGVFAPEEVYFPTMLALLGYLKDPPPPAAAGRAGAAGAAVGVEVERRMVTYADWPRRGQVCKPYTAFCILPPGQRHVPRPLLTPTCVTCAGQPHGFPCLERRIGARHPPEQVRKPEPY
jgi:hypothetical protein